jgi:addiction module RelE/StbE family toxin
MVWQLVFTQQYTKRLKRFLRQNPQVRPQYAKTIELLSLNPHHPSLRLHRLKGNLKTLYSISINMQHRITIKLIIEDDEIILVNVGSHGTVY